MYRKSYTGFVLWLIVFVVLMLALAFIPSEDEALITRLLLNLCTAGLAVLTWMIWRNERVYWYTGVSFEEAEAAGSERRKEYAFKHFWLFGMCALIALAFTLGAHLMGLPWWVDMAVVTIGLMTAAFRTTAYKL